MIKKILIANRGEIAVRIIRSCREMGIKTVAVYSDADRTALHVRYADEAYHIGPSPSVESYLNRKKILQAARSSKCDAIHPGYGFLSENQEFSDMVTCAGILFIGPSPQAIAAMGDKITARKHMIQAGVPVVPGINEKIPEKEMVSRIKREIGLPVMLKASAGGGGKGMRLVHQEQDILPALRAARSEAKAAFGDDTVYVEKYITHPHHIEFQILADGHGNVIHLMERECSVQRRHQKVVEETPSPIMTEKVRQEMGEHARQAARAVNYQGAGTIEFLVDGNLNYYFLEMNTRLQVEHPITEMVTGIDLVKEQILVAGGARLSYRQEDIKQQGHSIECRIYAEDAENDFMPSPGLVTRIIEPGGSGVRIDGYVYEGYTIPIYYDPMISKLVTWGKDRAEAIQRMRRALSEYQITGVKTSLGFLDRIMGTPDFVKDNYDTGFIEKNRDFLMNGGVSEKDKDFEVLAMLGAWLEYRESLKSQVSLNGSDKKTLNPWKQFARKKGVMRLL